MNYNRQKNFVLVTMIAFVLDIVGGCSSNDNYCCTSNDQCGSSNGKSTSCTMATCGKCEEVDPIQIQVNDWKDASVETSFDSEFTASGGIGPYTWEFTSSALDKLGWLTLTWEGQNNETARLRNRDDQYPTSPTTGDGIPLTITVKDDTRHGEKIRLDNQGASKDLYLKIVDMVAEPKFNPQQGTYSTDQAISLSCDTSGASIYYTTDGITTPTTASTLYADNPIQVTGPNNITAIMAIAVKEGMTQSVVTSVTYTVRYQYKLTINSLAGGTTSPSGTITANHGEATSITATPDDYYKFLNWTATGTGVTFGDANSASTTVTLTGGDATIQANFAPPIIDVYVAGYEYSGTSTTVPKVWKNGAVTVLPTANSSPNWSDARSVFVYGPDVYVGGIALTETNYSATVWRNGQTFETLNVAKTGGVGSVFVSGNLPDVYAGGYINNGTDNHGVAYVWKNGQILYTLSSGTTDAYTSSVYVSGSDVYAAVNEHTDTTTYKEYVRIYKNGQPFQILADGTTYAAVQSVFVSGTLPDVYAAGFNSNETKSFATVWKNGTVTALTDGTQNVRATSVFVSGDDIYVAGYVIPSSYSIGLVWKNGQLIQTLGTGTQSDSTTLTSIFVSGNDIYVAGCKGNGTKSVATVWKNGEAKALTDGTNNACAYSVFVTVQ